LNSDETSERFQKTFLAIQSSSTVAHALQLLQDSYPVDFVTYHLALTIADVVDTPYVRTTYPDSWVSRYLLNGYVTVDPIVREGFLRQLPFDWCELEISDVALAFLSDAKEHGIGANGYSIPIVDKSRRALLSVNSNKPAPRWDTIVADCRNEWTELGFLIHQKAIVELYGEHDPIPVLAAREIECLYWAALGKDSKDTAQILCLSDHTTRSYLRSARFKLGCATTSAATALATQLRLINPYGNTLN
jgi:DNA-binding CsgD family transcriptional regulator